MKKEYFIRIYTFFERDISIINDGIDVGLFALTKRFNGVNGCLSIYDVKMSQKGLELLITLNIPYFPLNNYEDFVITCPNCGERIEDEMILNDYGENVLSGYNINCKCGCQMAKVEYC